ncbi:N-6 DNA methylase [Meiothermus sp. CFH 77666]|uniref:N-6 DNA methylase n=1 Tax=Meiothermus sp. CFH 77666 TaxID=2817942 RepID=UPI001AA03B27|nr:N-6 DNA methylase [Meiothermus sp. CFH 77666]MBO1437357.1 N-6 DNA methylase [Meiothermus sp. CFH 77666]
MKLALLPDNPRGEAAKAMGAYYTDAAVALFLVRWALRAPHETAADPAFGGGVFLAAASEHLQRLGGHPGQQIYGVEIDPAVRRRTAAVLEAHFSIPAQHLFCADFFELKPPDLRVDCMLGNPPFIRYQRFSGTAREKALRRAAEQGVELSKLAGSWAAFVVHAAAFLKPGGRLGMVVPAELGHAAYARPVLEYLAEFFKQVSLITFREKLFPHLSQDVLLLLAEGWQERAESVDHVALLDLQSAADLETLQLPYASKAALEVFSLISGRERLPLYWIPPAARELYRGLRDAPQTFRLGQLADVGIGYVTGNNDFFHLSPAQAEQWNIPQAFLKPAVRRGGALRGLRFTKADWSRAVQIGEAGFLLHIPPEAELPPGVRLYLQQGQINRVHQAYKCRVRQPWYSVPHVHRPDAFLTYMSGHTPHLVANEAGAVAPNSLHILRLKATAPLSAKALAALWQTSLTRLSVELEGHAMGGGMLKLEPGEAARAVLASPTDISGLEALADELDSLLKKGRAEQAQALADQVILLEGLGLTQQEVTSLSGASQYLRLRRQRKLAGL